jgi:hypothetical protein
LEFDRMSQRPRGKTPIRSGFLRVMPRAGVLAIACVAASAPWARGAPQEDAPLRRQAAAPEAAEPGAQTMLHGEVTLARLVDLCAAQQGFEVEYAAADLAARVTIRVADPDSKGAAPVLFLSRRVCVRGEGIGRADWSHARLLAFGRGGERDL